MKTPRPKPDRPWWRGVVRYVLRVRPRRRHVHGTWLHKLLGERLLSPELWIPNRDSLARGVATGVFAGLLPLPGIQIFLSAFLCYILRSNIAGAVLATFVSNPFSAPGILWLQYRFGLWLLPAVEYVDMSEYGGAGGYFAAYGKPILVGSLTSALLAGILLYPVTLGAWTLAERAVRRRRMARLRARLARGGALPQEQGPPAGDTGASAP